MTQEVDGQHGDRHGRRLGVIGLEGAVRLEVRHQVALVTEIHLLHPQVGKAVRIVLAFFRNPFLFQLEDEPAVLPVHLDLEQIAHHHLGQGAQLGQGVRRVGTGSHPGLAQVDLLRRKGAVVAAARLGPRLQRVRRVAEGLDPVRDLDHRRFQLLGGATVQPGLEHGRLERLLVLPFDGLVGVQGQQLQVLDAVHVGLPGDDELAQERIELVQVVDDLLGGIVEQRCPHLQELPGVLLAHVAVDEPQALKSRGNGGIVVDGGNLVDVGQGFRDDGLDPFREFDGGGRYLLPRSARGPVVDLVEGIVCVERARRNRRLGRLGAVVPVLEQLSMRGGGHDEQGRCQAE